MIAELGLRIHADGARQTTNELERLTTTAGRTERAATSLSRNVRTMGGGFSRMGPQVQQASYQVADFAVQVGAGTSATRALSMQLPQLLAGFGVMGAAMGAVVAVGGALVPMLFRMGEGATSAADAMDDYAEALSEFRDAADAATMRTEDLIERFGSWADSMRETLILMQQLEMQESLEAMRTAARNISVEFEDLFQSVDRVAQAQAMLADVQDAGMPAITRDAQAQLEEAQRQLENFADEMRLTGDQATQLRDALSAIGEASGIDGVVAATGQLEQLMLDIYGTTQNIPAEFQTLLARVLAAKTTTAELAGTMEDADRAAKSVAATDIASGIGAGADEAARLAQNLFSAATAQAAFADQAQRTATPENQLGFGVGGVGDPSVGSANLGFGANPGGNTRRNVIDMTSRIPQAGRSGGGGGGISEADQDLEQFRRTLEGFRTEGQAAAAQLAELEANFGRFQGQLTPEQVSLYGQAIDELREALSRTEDGVTEFGEEMASRFPGITELFDDARGAARRFLETLADQAWQNALARIFSGIGGGAGGGGGLLGGRIIPGILHEGGVAGVDGYGHGRSVSSAIFANAERYHSGGIAGLRANEVPAILERGERVIPKGQSEAQEVRVVVGVDRESGYLQGYVDDRARGVAAPMVGSAARVQHRSYGSRARSFQMRGTT